MSNTVEQFAELVRQYRAWVLTGTDTGPEAARQALGLVSQLYVAALSLPPQWCGDREDVEIDLSAIQTSESVYKSLGARLPIGYYGEVFNPMVVPPEEPVLGDLADDLADIFGDLNLGLLWFEAGYPAEAVWEWGFHMVYHWGEHATSAIRALHFWLAAEHRELLSGSK